MRFFVGKSLKLPVIGRVYTGLSTTIRCKQCGRVHYEGLILLGLLAFWYLAHLLVSRG
jgi:hypothetical protein